MSLAIKIADLLTAIATDIKTITTSLLSKLDLTGGVLTGHLSSKSNSFRTHILTTTTGSKNLDLSAYSIFEYTITGNTTIVFTNLPDTTNDTLVFVLRLTMGATLRTITFSDYIVWLTQDGVTPTVPTINKLKEYIITYSNGSYVGRVIPF